MKLKNIYFPFLFAVFSIIALYTSNYSERIKEIEVFSVIMIILVFIYLLMLALKKFINSLEKVVFLLFVFLVYFFFYGHMVVVLETVFKLKVRTRYFFPIYNLIFASIVYLILKTKKDFYSVNKILNVIVSCILVVSLINLSFITFRKMNLIKKSKHIEEKKQTKTEYQDDNKQNKRDIYYIILDGYAANSTLKELYNFDNKEFLDSLDKRDFFITHNSFSNYPYTHMSIPSSLNLEYLTHEENISDKDYTIKYSWPLIENNKVLNFVKSNGYKYVHVDGSGGMTSFNKYADINIRINQNTLGFLRLFLQTTIFRPFLARAELFFAKRAIVESINNTFDSINIKGPKFVFSHIVCPHPPFVLGEYSFISSFRWGRHTAKNKEFYVIQVTALNKYIEKLVDKIIENSSIKPIIIIQADHGSGYLFENIDDRLWNNPTKQMLKERFGILNAYYFPGGGDKLLYDSISPVNTFRLIFNYYFNENHKLLDDFAYYYKKKRITDKNFTIKKWIDVTEKL